MKLHETLNSHLSHCYPWLTRDPHNCSMLPSFSVLNKFNISSSELIQTFILHKIKCYSLHSATHDCFALPVITHYCLQFQML